MKSVIQRVKRAEVNVDDSVVGHIGSGLLILLGVERGDTAADAEAMAERVCELRIFEDEAKKMNRSIIEVGGSILVVSQFTLAADCRKGRRPSFDNAAPPDMAERLYLHFVETLRARHIPCATGAFGAFMQVALVNDGPVTFVLESKKQTDNNAP